MAGSKILLAVVQLVDLSSLRIYQEDVVAKADEKMERWKVDLSSLRIHQEDVVAKAADEWMES